MRRLTRLVAASLAIGASLCAAEPSPFKGKIDVVCGQGIYQCLTDAEVKVLGGKTLKYHHPRGDEFGDVSIELKINGSAYGMNRKGGSGGGTWEAKEGKLFMKFSGWGEQTLPLLRIGTDHLYWLNVRGAGVLVPIEVIE